MSKKVTLYILGGLFLLWVFDSLLFKASVVGQYANTGFENSLGGGPEIPYLADTLTLSIDGKAYSQSFGSGTYKLEHSFMSTKIFLRFEYIYFGFHIEREGFYPVIWLNEECNHRYDYIAFYE